MEEKLLRIPLFEGVPQAALDMLLEDECNGRRTYEENDYVVRQGAPCRSLYILTEGLLHATMANAEGKELIIEQLSAPEILAPAFLFGEENRFPVNLIARTTSHVSIISKVSFLQFMHKYPSVMENFVAQISNRCIFLSKKLNEFALQDLRQRVIAYLKRYGRIRNQQQTASVLGVARPSLARVLSELHKENIIRREGNEIVLA